VAQSPGDLGFFDEKGHGALAAQLGGVEEFEGDGLVHEGVVGPVYDAHAAFSEQIAELISFGNEGSGLELQGICGGIGGFGDLHGAPAAETNALPALYSGRHKDTGLAVWTGDGNHGGGGMVARRRYGNNRRGDESRSACRSEFVKDFFSKPVDIPEDRSYNAAVTKELSVLKGNGVNCLHWISRTLPNGRVCGLGGVPCAFVSSENSIASPSPLGECSGSHVVGAR